LSNPTYEIVNIVHQNQTTILQDIQHDLHKNKENYGARLFEVYRNLVVGLDEVIKKLRTIIDSSKIDEKEKIEKV
jgi:hypothetical protein